MAKKAKSKAGLTKKKVVVHRKGKTFTQTRMVRAGAALQTARTAISSRLATVHKSASAALKGPHGKRNAAIGLGAVAAAGGAAYLAHRAIKARRAKKGKKGARAEAPRRPSAFAQKAWGAAAVLAPILGAAVGSTLGEVHGGRASEHFAARATKSAGRGKGFGATLLHGGAALLRSQGSGLASMAGGALGTSFGAYAVHKAHGLAHRR